MQKCQIADDFCSCSVRAIKNITSAMIQLMILVIFLLIYKGSESATVGKEDKQRTTGIEETLERCKYHLKELYLQRKSKIRFGSNWKSIADTDSLFVNLTLLPKAEGEIKIKKNQKQPDSPTDLLCIKDDKGHFCKHVLLRGNAGCGKSTLINKLAHAWSLIRRHPDTSVLNQFCFVIVLDVNKFKRGDNLQRTIQEQILPDLSEDEISKVIRSAKNSCLFLIDGYDEMPRECLEDQTQVLDNPLLVGCWVIVTTRPHMVDLFCQKFHGYVHVEVSGFSKISVNIYVEKFFKVHPLVSVTSDLAKSLLLRIQMVPILEKLSNYPILLLMICHLWLDRQNEPDIPENLTKLYKEAVEYLNKHWQERYKKNRPKLKVVVELGRIAIDPLFEGKLSFTGAKGNEFLEDGCEIGLIYREEMERNKTEYTFIHKTFHEFCAGVYLASLADVVDDDIAQREFVSYLQKLDTIDEIKRMEYVLLFCCGSSDKAAAFVLRHVCTNTLDAYSGSREEKLNIPLKLFCEAETNLETQGDAKVAKEMKTTISDALETIDLRQIKISANTFSPYPFNMNILLKFLQCFSTLQTLTLSDVHIIGTLDSNTRVSCESLNIHNVQICNLDTLLKLLSCMPNLMNVLLHEVIRNSDEWDTVAPTKLRSLRTLKVYGPPGMAGAMKLASFIPSLEQLIIKKAEVEEWSVNTLRLCDRLRELKITPSVNFEINETQLIEFLDCMPSLREAKLCNIVMNGSIEGLLQPPKCYALTELTIHNDRPFMYVSDANMFVGVLRRLSLLQKLSLSYIQISGDLETNVQFQWKHLKEFNLKVFGSNRKGRMPRAVFMCDPSKPLTDAYKGNNLVMFCRIFSCMPFLEQFKFKYGYSRVSKVNNAVMFSAYIHRVYRQIEFTTCTMNAKTLLMTVSRMRALKTLSLVDVILTGDCDAIKCEENKSLVNFNLTRTSISLNTLHTLLSRMPSVSQLRCICCTITGPLTNSYLSPSRKRLTRLQMKGDSNNCLLQYHSSLMPSLTELITDFDVLHDFPTKLHTNSMAVEQLFIFYENINDSMMMDIRRFFGMMSSVGVLTLKYSNDELSKSENIPAINGNILINLLHCIPAINKLIIRNISINGPISVSEAPCKALTELHIGNSIVAEKTISLTVLQLLPSLKALSLVNVSISTEICEYHPAKSDSLKKFVLGFSDLHTTPLSRDFLRYMPSLESLTIENIKLPIAFDAELPLICNELKEFNLLYTSDKHYIHGFSVEEFPLMTSLHTLSFMNVDVKEEESEEDSADTKMFSSLRAFHLSYPGFYRPSCASSAGYSPSCDDSTLVKVLRRTPFLETLCICNVAMTNTLDASILLAGRLIKYMTLVDVKISGENLTSLLSHLSSVETLFVKDVDITGQLPDSVQASCKSLEEFHLQTCRKREISGANLKTLLDSMTSLRALHLSIQQCDAMDDLCENRIKLYSTLKTLTISCSNFEDPVKDYYYYDYMDNEPKKHNLCVILTFISCVPLLETLTLEIIGKYTEILDSVFDDWNVMPKSERLKEFSLVYKEDQENCREENLCITYDTLTELLKCLPNLQTLTLCSCYIENCAKKYEKYATTFKSLFECKLQTCRTSGAALLKLLAGMTSLQKLTLADVDFSFGNLYGIDDKYFDLNTTAICEELTDRSDIDENMRKRIRDMASTFTSEDRCDDSDCMMTTDDDNDDDNDDNDCNDGDVDDDDQIVHF